MKKKLVMGAVVLAAALAVLAVVQARKPRTDGRTLSVTARVEKGPLLITVRASGEIRARRSNRVVPGAKRSENVEFLVAEGSRVTNGQIVARLSTTDMERKILDAELKVADADGKLLSASTDCEVQILDNQAAMTTAVQAVQSAELSVKKFVEGDMPMQVKTAELKVSTTASEYERGIKKFAESKEILKQGFITEDQLEEERIKLETAKVEKETAVDELRTLKLYTLPLKEAEALNAKIKADTDLEKTRKKNAVKLQTAQLAMEQARAVLSKATNDLAEMRQDILAYEVKSPSDGIVTYGDPERSWRRSEIQVGMTLMPGEVLLTIPDMSSLQAVVDVPESDIPKVKVGQPVTLTVEAITHQTFSGTVDRVSEIADPGGFLESAVKMFKVYVAVDSIADMRPGFSCDAEILIETLPSALTVPIQAVFSEGEELVVYIDSALGPVRTPVQVGKSSITRVEIKAGLQAGQLVLLSSPPTANNGAEEKKP